MMLKLFNKILIVTNLLVVAQVMGSTSSLSTSSYQASSTDSSALSFLSSSVPVMTSTTTTSEEKKESKEEREVRSKKHKLDNNEAMPSLFKKTNGGKEINDSQKKEEKKVEEKTEEKESLAAWVKVCNELPENKGARHHTSFFGMETDYHLEVKKQVAEISGKKTVKNYEDYLKKAKDFVQAFQVNADFRSANKWLQGAPDDKLFGDGVPNNFHPYAQKLIITKDANVGFMGDIHGSVHSLLRNLNKLKKQGYLDDNFNIVDKGNKKFYLVFLGDYVDRGCYSVEVLYILMTLKILNFDRVFLIRGNHEYWGMANFYGFTDEIKAKFNDSEDTLFKKICDCFELLPLAIYLGVTENDKHTSFIQCCHAGVEPFYDPTALLSGTTSACYEQLFKTEVSWSKINKNSEFEAFTLKLDTVALVTKVILSSGSGFAWCDFGEIEDEVGQSPRGVCIKISNAGVKQFLRLLNEQLKEYNVSLNGIYRGHDHANYGLKLFNEKGMNVHWTEVITKSPPGIGFNVLQSGPVFTFSTSTEALIPERYDCFCRLIIGDTYDKWRLLPYEEELKDYKDCFKTGFF